MGIEDCPKEEREEERKEKEETSDEDKDCPKEETSDEYEDCPKEEQEEPSEPHVPDILQDSKKISNSLFPNIEIQAVELENSKWNNSIEVSSAAANALMDEGAASSIKVEVSIEAATSNEKIDEGAASSIEVSSDATTMKEPIDESKKSWSDMYFEWLEEQEQEKIEEQKNMNNV